MRDPFPYFAETPAPSYFASTSIGNRLTIESFKSSADFHLYSYFRVHNIVIFNRFDSHAFRSVRRNHSLVQYMLRRSVACSPLFMTNGKLKIKALFPGHQSHAYAYIKKKSTISLFKMLFQRFLTIKYMMSLSFSQESLNIKNVCVNFFHRKS